MTTYRLICERRPRGPATGVMRHTVAFSADTRAHAIAHAVAFARELLGAREGSLILLDQAGTAIWEWTQQA